MRSVGTAPAGPVATGDEPVNGSRRTATGLGLAVAGRGSADGGGAAGGPGGATGAASCEGACRWASGSGTSAGASPQPAIPIASEESAAAAPLMLRTAIAQTVCQRARSCPRAGTPGPFPGGHVKHIDQIAVVWGSGGRLPAKRSIRSMETSEGAGWASRSACWSVRLTSRNALPAIRVSPGTTGWRPPGSPEHPSSARRQRARRAMRASRG